MFTIATGGYVPFVLNLHASLARIGLGDQLVVYSLDDRAHRVLSRAGVRSVRYGTGPGRQWTNWRTLGFMRTMSYKYSAALDILRSGKKALYVDSDIVFLRDPANYLQSVMATSEADLVLQFQSPKNLYSAGFWLASPTEPVIELLLSIWTALQSKQYTDDEDTLNWRLRQTDGVATYALDSDLFACGNRFLVSEEKRKSYTDSGGRPFNVNAAYILHFNYVIGKEAKVRAMMKHNAVFYAGLEKHCRTGMGAVLSREVRRFARRVGTVQQSLSGRPMAEWPGVVFELLLERKARLNR
ncbi:MAG: putative nucleotide-diphospho-sugar transferase [Vicinamibacterales bacterium]